MFVLVVWNMHPNPSIGVFRHTRGIARPLLHPPPLWAVVVRGSNDANVLCPCMLRALFVCRSVPSFVKRSPSQKCKEACGPDFAYYGLQYGRE